MASWDDDAPSSAAIVSTGVTDIEDNFSFLQTLIESLVAHQVGNTMASGWNPNDPSDVFIRGPLMQTTTSGRAASIPTAREGDIVWDTDLKKILGRDAVGATWKSQAVGINGPAAAASGEVVLWTGTSATTITTSAIVVDANGNLRASNTINMMKGVVYSGVVGQITAASCAGLWFFDRYADELHAADLSPMTDHVTHAASYICVGNNVASGYTLAGTVPATYTTASVYGGNMRYQTFSAAKDTYFKCDDHVDFSFVTGAASSFSMIVLANPTTAASRVLLSKSYYPNYEWVFELNTNASLGLKLFSAGASAVFLSKTSQPAYTTDAGSWHVYGCTYDGSATTAGMFLYRDGALLTSITLGASGVGYAGMTNTVASMGSRFNGLSVGASHDGCGGYAFAMIQKTQALAAGPIKVISNLLLSYAASSL